MIKARPEGISDLEHVAMHVYGCAQTLLMRGKPEYQPLRGQVGINPALAVGQLRNIETIIMASESPAVVTAFGSHKDQAIVDALTRAMDKHIGAPDTTHEGIEVPAGIATALFVTAIGLSVVYEAYAMGAMSALNTTDKASRGRLESILKDIVDEERMKKNEVANLTMNVSMN